MNVKLNIYTKEAAEAFAVFCQTMAKALPSEAENRANFSVGGLSSFAGPWVNRTAETDARADAAAKDEASAFVAGLAKASEPAPAAVEPAPAAEPEKPKRGRKAKAEAAPEPEAAQDNIRVNPEDRQPPADPQDAKDEAAEKPAASKITHDDVRAVLTEYYITYGEDAAMEDGPKLFERAFPGKGVAKISQIPDTQEALSLVLEGAKEMLTKNPFKRTAQKAA